MNAEPVALAAQTQPANTVVKTIVPITAKPKNKLWHKLKSLQIQQMLMAEFRIDLLSFASDTKQVIALGHELKDSR